MASISLPSNAPERHTLTHTAFTRQPHRLPPHSTYAPKIHIHIMDASQIQLLMHATVERCPSQRTHLFVIIHAVRIGQKQRIIFVCLRQNEYFGDELERWVRYIDSSTCIGQCEI